MRNNIFRTLLTLAFAAFTLPMLSQDFMNIHFKDGSLKTFHFNTLVELYTSAYDNNGVSHVDIQYQHVKTNYDEFVYDINDIDSISFTKYDERKEEENYVSTMTNVLPQLSDCETIDDVENKLDDIKQSEGVENAWTEGKVLNIKVKGGLTISFNFDTSYIWDVSSTDIDSFVEETLARAKKVVVNNDKPLKVVIAHQQYNDLRAMYPRFRNYAKKLKKKFEEGGNRCDFFQPQLDFFYGNVKEQNAEQLSIYDYDLVLLTTHGFYMEDGDFHGFLTGEELGRYPKTGENYEKDNENEYIKVCDKYWNILTDQNYKKAMDHMTVAFQPEIVGYKEIIDKNNNKRKVEVYDWVAYIQLKESFFKDVAIGEFKNPKSIFFNAACKTLMNNHSMAETFMKNRKLGTYLGYTESNWKGPESGIQYFTYMLAGLSSEKAYEELANEKLDLWSDDMTSHVIGTAKDEQHYNIKETTYQTIREFDHTASLEFVQKKEDKSIPVFLYPVKTNEIDSEKANQEFNEKGYVTVEGMMNNPAFNQEYQNLYECGFKLFVDLNETNYGQIPSWNAREIDDIRGEFLYSENHFLGKLTGLERGKTYFCQAYLYDGLYYNYGSSCQFKIEDYPTLTLSSSTLTLSVYSCSSIQITSGSGSYTVENKTPSTISVEFNEEENIISITALSAGPGTIIVTDNKTGQTKEITVEVKDSESSSGWVNLISNGDMESTDVSCFFERTGTYEIDAYHATISNGVGKNGSRGIKVAATARQKEHYDNQFWFRMTEPISVDTKYRFSFDYRADKNARINMEIHNEPAVYNYFTDWETECTPEWRTFTAEGIVSSNDSPSTKPFHSIAINLSWCSEANNYYFDNIKFEIYKEGEEPVADLALSSTSPISLKVGESKTITITSGSGNYSVKSSDDKVASVSRNGNTVTIKAVSAGPATITITDIKSGKTKSIEVEVKATSGVISYTACPDTHHPHWIDLGLPSGTKWSCCNEGASAPEEFGEYYEYGEVLTAPSQVQGEELIKNTTYSWGTLNGVNGGLFTGKNGGAIFLPATGSNTKGKLEYVGEEGHYWPLASGSYIWTLGFNSDYPEMWTGFYYGGVRGIRRTVRSVSK